MVRKIQRTFDWDVLVRCFAAAMAIYVLANVFLHRQPGIGRVGAAVPFLAAS